MMSEREAIVVFTSATIDSILAAGGSRGWVLNQRRAQGCQHIVFCRNEHWDNRAEGTPHRAAFLIGKISGLVQLTPPDDRVQRFLVQISEFAPLVQANVWKTTWRNPVAYRTLTALGIDVNALVFEPVPQPAASSGKVRKMTIAAAKAALAESLGVTPDDIDIIIRG